MERCTACVGSLVWAVLVICNHGQLSAQTVQLPVLRSFTTTGAVSVPDQGSASMAGVNRFRSHRSATGIPLTGGLRNRSSSRQVGSSNISVKATIIDLDELDRQVLAAAKPKPKKMVSEVDRRAAYIARNIARYVPLPTSTKSALRNDSRSSKANQKEFLWLIEKGDAAYEKGKTRLAQNFYRNALNMAAAADRPKVLERIEKLRR